MDSQNLKQFFLGVRSINEITDEISVEVEAFRISRMKRGSSCSIHCSNEEFEYEVKTDDLKKLCESYLLGEINEWHLEYICNVIEMSDAFLMESDEIVDVIFQLSTSEINAPITPDSVRDLCTNL